MKVFGRDDLAAVSYHMGIGNLSNVVRAYTARENDPIDTIVDEADIDYPRLYFDSSPTGHRASWELLTSFGDDSQTYYWRVLGALGVMHLFAMTTNDSNGSPSFTIAYRALDSCFTPDCPRAVRRCRTASRTPSHVACSFPFGPTTVRISRWIRNS
jgi:hypothetical protein